jgi:tRNA-binding protein
METISWADFEKVELRVGTIIDVEDFPEARKPAFKLKVDFGDEDLMGRQVLAVVNFPPRQIGPMRSECLVTGFHRQDGAVVLAEPDSNVPNGAKLA